MHSDDPITDAKGNELQRADRGVDNAIVPERMQNKAAIIGAIHLLQDIARRDDNPRFRNEAVKMGDALKGILRRLVKTGAFTAEDILGVQQLEEPRRALPEPRKRISNDVTDV